MLRESYMASMWLAHGYMNSSPVKLDRLRQTAEDHVMAWVADHEPATGAAAQVACSKVLDADRVEVDVTLPLSQRILRYLYTLSENRIQPMPVPQ